MPWRFNACKVGLTYSCPTDAEDNPISDVDYIISAMEIKFGPGQYIVCKELHESGKTHYHAYFKFDAKIDSTDVKCFDLCGVHPNVVKAPKRGWVLYCAKHGEFKTNFYEADVWVSANEAVTWQEASDLLWTKQPKFMLQVRLYIERVPTSPRRTGVW